MDRTLFERHLRSKEGDNVILLMFYFLDTFGFYFQIRGVGCLTWGGKPVLVIFPLDFIIKSGTTLPTNLYGVI